VREPGAHLGGISGQAVSNLATQIAQGGRRDKQLGRRLAAIEKAIRKNVDDLTPSVERSKIKDVTP